MSMKRKMLAVAAVMTLAGGLSTVGTVAASAATPQCGMKCLEVYSLKYATPPTNPTNLGFVETVFQGIAAVGVPAIVQQASSSNPAEDLMVPMAGTASSLAAQGWVSAEVGEHFGSDPAVQIEYAPFGQPTGLCSAVATTAYQNEGLSLQPCSTPGTTIWILDIPDSPVPGYFPIVNGSNTDFNRPFVMTILGNPAHQVTPIILQHFKGGANNVPANQLWSDHHGPVS